MFYIEIYKYIYYICAYTYHQMQNAISGGINYYEKSMVKGIEKLHEGNMLFYHEFLFYERLYVCMYALFLKILFMIEGKGWRKTLVC